MAPALQKEAQKMLPHQYSWFCMRRTAVVIQNAGGSIHKHQKKCE